MKESANYFLAFRFPVSISKTSSMFFQHQTRNPFTNPDPQNGGYFEDPNPCDTQRRFFSKPGYCERSVPWIDFRTTSSNELSREFRISFVSAWKRRKRHICYKRSHLSLFGQKYCSLFCINKNSIKNNHTRFEQEKYMCKLVFQKSNCFSRNSSVSYFGTILSALFEENSSGLMVKVSSTWGSEVSHDFVLKVQTATLWEEKSFYQTSLYFPWSICNMQLEATKCSFINKNST